MDSEGTSPCPVCRCGRLQALSLMDALACDFCNHIFTVEPERQQIKLPSRQPPLVWHWNGKNWIGAHLEGVEVGWSYVVLAIAFVMLPPTLIGLTIYAIPSTPGTPLSELPYFWTGLTFLSHLGIIVWIATEFYQFPVRTYLRAMQQRLLSR